MEITDEKFRQIMETREFRQFNDEITRRVKELHELVEANVDKYDCSLFVSLVSLNGEEQLIHTTAFTGRAHSFMYGFAKVFKNSPRIGNLILNGLLGSGAAKKVGEIEITLNSENNGTE